LPLRVAIAGTGPEELALKMQSKKLKLHNRITFLGHVKDELLPGLYSSSLMGVFPSYGREGILTTMLENAACGRPTITTTACSMSEFLRDGYNGLLVKPKNSQDLASSIKRLYLDKRLANKLGAKARKSIETSWSWPKKIKQVEKVYADIFNHH
jgi:glycosyltransferase involved in cell wall biosynthesis